MQRLGLGLVDSYGYLAALDLIGHHYSELISECRATGDPYWICYALGIQAVSLALSGKAGHAEAKATEAIDAAVRLGNPDCLSWALFSYGTAIADEDLGRATDALERSASAARSVGCSWHLLLSLELVQFQRADGRLAEAATSILEALEIIARIGNRSQLGQTYRLAASVLAASVDAGGPRP